MTAELICRDLEEGIARLARELPGRLGVVVRFLESDREVRFNAGDRFTAASVIKVPIMVEVYRQVAAGALSLGETVALDAADMTGGAGVLQYLHPGLPLTVEDAVELMISISDNTSTNVVLRRIGVEPVNEAMRSLGLTDTSLAGLFGRARAPEHRNRVSQTTPHDISLLLTALARSELIDAAASAAMLRHLSHTTHQDMLPRYLPLTPQPDRLGFPGLTVEIAHKTGSLTGIRHDAGIFSVTAPSGRYRTVVSAFTGDVADDDLWTPENIGERALASLGRLVFEASIRMIDSAGPEGRMPLPPGHQRLR